MKEKHYALAWVGGLTVLVLLLLAARYWWTYLSPGAILRAAKAGDVERVQALIARGVDLDAKDWHGWRPLHLAAKGGHVEVVRALLNAGAQVHSPGDYDETALQVAARAAQPEIAAILLSHGANVHADAWGVLPIEWAAQSDSRTAETVRVLLEGGADPNGRRLRPTALSRSLGTRATWPWSRSFWPMEPM